MLAMVHIPKVELLAMPEVVIMAPIVILEEILLPIKEPPPIVVVMVAMLVVVMAMLMNPAMVMVAMLVVVMAMLMNPAVVPMLVMPAAVTPTRMMVPTGMALTAALRPAVAALLSGLGHANRPQGQRCSRDREKEPSHLKLLLCLCCFGLHLFACVPSKRYANGAAAADRIASRRLTFPEPGTMAWVYAIIEARSEISRLFKRNALQVTSLAP
jgi:hypothetical protein